MIKKTYQGLDVASRAPALLPYCPAAVLLPLPLFLWHSTRRGGGGGLCRVNVVVVAV
jgi:hypothetical protein